MIYLSREEFDAAIDKIMAKLNDLEKKINAVNFNISHLLSNSKTEFDDKPKIDLIKDSGKKKVK